MNQPLIQPTTSRFTASPQEVKVSNHLRFGIPYRTVQPPSTLIVSPLMFLAYGPIKNSVMPPSSSISMNRPLGIGFSIISLITCKHSGSGLCVR